MLKSRLRKCDLDRKRKQPDISYAVRVALEKESYGKDITLVIRGRVVTFGDVKNTSNVKVSSASNLS
jgi:hypothetical protein